MGAIFCLYRNGGMQDEIEKTIFGDAYDNMYAHGNGANNNGG